MGPIQILFLCSLVVHVHIFVFNCIDLFLPLKALKESLSLRSFIPIFSDTKRIIFNLDLSDANIECVQKLPICLLLAFVILMKALRDPFVRQERSQDYSYETCSQNLLVDNKIKCVCYL